MVENAQLEKFSESKGDMTTKPCVCSSGKKKGSGIFNYFIITFDREYFFRNRFFCFSHLKLLKLNTKGIF